MNIGQSFSRRFWENPIAWILGGLLAGSVYFHYRTGVEFTRVCETIASLEQGYFDLETTQSYEPTGIDLDAIMMRVKKHERLMQVNTAEGRAYRWWQKEADYLERTCRNRPADHPDPQDDY
jgi:hypothetical protein